MSVLVIVLSSVFKLLCVMAKISRGFSSKNTRSSFHKREKTRSDMANSDKMVELRRALDALNSSFDLYVNAEGWDEAHQTHESAIERAKSFSASLEKHCCGPSPLFKLFTRERLDVFEMHVLPKLGRCERLFVRQLNRESREAIMSVRARLLRGRLLDLSSVSQYKFVLQYRKNPPSHINSVICETENLDIIRYVHECNRGFDFSKGTAAVAARLGNFEIFKYVISKGAPFDAKAFRVLDKDRHTNQDKARCYEFLKSFEGKQEEEEEEEDDFLWRLHCYVKGTITREELYDGFSSLDEVESSTDEDESIEYLAKCFIL
jgi:hypothetical protein